MDDKGSGQAWHVLLVEDTPMNQRVERAMLEYCGCRVDIAENGQEAVDAFFRERYDIIFMDCQMPVMDGYETTGVIRGMESKSRETGAVSPIPIIALTAYAMEGDREQCLRAGMDDYLSKPFSIGGLQAIVDRWLVKAGTSETRKTGAGDAAVAGAGSGKGEGPLGQGEEAPPVERAPLDMIASLQPAGGADVLKRIISLYLDSSLGQMKSIGAAVAGHDADALHRAAHTLKSSSANLGAMVFSGMCKDLEMMGRNNTLEAASARLADLEREYARVRESLEKHAADRG